MVLNILKAAIGFSVMIFIHELGHFIACKLVGVRVEVFSIGFVPVIKKKFGETEYAIGAIPFGGYVKPAGGDLSAEAESTGAPEEFLSKNFWEKSFILIAGPFMNVILAIISFWVIAFFIGVVDYQPDNRVGGPLEEGFPALENGLMIGDRIEKINGKETKAWSDIIEVIGKSEGKEQLYTIKRGDNVFQVKMAPKKDPNYGHYRIGITQFIEPVIGRLDKDSPAFKAGLREGDRIVEMNGEEVITFPMIEASEEPLYLKVIREGRVMGFEIVPEKMGGLTYTGDYEKQFSYGLSIFIPRKKLPLLESLHYSVKMTGVGLFLIFQSLKLISQKLSNAKQLGGPILITYILYETSKSGLGDLLSIIGLLSINLAFINLFPLIIITDGGQITIFAIEHLRKKQLSVENRARLNFIGFLLVIMLAVFVIVNDVIRFF
ncbi:MAG TPA: RIP metalloprotease RseP [Firmicutes bacterium]|nr:RIP metalloprotease RseP [Bacillota bacterium]